MSDTEKLTLAIVELAKIVNNMLDTQFIQAKEIKELKKQVEVDHV